MINGRLTAEQGALLNKALELGVEQLFQEQKDVHEEGYGIRTGAFGEITFTLPDGRVLPNNQHGRFRGNVIELKARNRQNGLEIDENTAVPDLNDGNLDYGMAMDVLGLLRPSISTLPL